MQDQNTKQCPKCNKEKLLEEFYKNRSRKDGCAVLCIRCWKQSEAERRHGIGDHRKGVFPRKGAFYDLPEGHKYCSMCKTVKPYSEFYPSKYGSHGRNTQCIPCSLNMTLEYRRAKGIGPRVKDPSTKKCPKCGETKTLAEFPKDVLRSRGINCYCFTCFRVYARTMAKDHGYYHRHYLSEKRKQLWRTPRWKAGRMVAAALKLGVLTRGPCAVCGATKVHGHHADYMKPLEVTWLCHLHHSHAHGKLLDQK